MKTKLTFFAFILFTFLESTKLYSAFRMLGIIMHSLLSVIGLQVNYILRSHVETHCLQTLLTLTETYGIDHNIEGDIEEEEGSLILPHTQPTLTSQSMETLQSSVNVLQDSDSYGADLYVSTLVLVARLMENN